MYVLKVCVFKTTNENTSFYIYIYIFFFYHAEVVERLRPLFALYENVQAASQTTKSTDKKTVYRPAVEVPCRRIVG